jgi:hypothetical protein
MDAIWEFPRILGGAVGLGKLQMFCSADGSMKGFDDRCEISKSE